MLEDSLHILYRNIFTSVPIFGISFLIIHDLLSGSRRRILCCYGARFAPYWGLGRRDRSPHYVPQQQMEHQGGSTLSRDETQRRVHGSAEGRQERLPSRLCRPHYFGRRRTEVSSCLGTGEVEAMDYCCEGHVNSLILLSACCRFVIVCSRDQEHFSVDRLALNYILMTLIVDSISYSTP